MQAGNDLPSSSRALVRLAPDDIRFGTHRTVSRPAAFLAHLIATARQLPQARERRRAEPADVIATYRAAIERVQKMNAEKSTA